MTARFGKRDAEDFFEDRLLLRKISFTFEKLGCHYQKIDSVKIESLKIQSVKIQSEKIQRMKVQSMEIQRMKI